MFFFKFWNPLLFQYQHFIDREVLESYGRLKVGDTPPQPAHHIHKRGDTLRSGLSSSVTEPSKFHTFLLWMGNPYQNYHSNCCHSNYFSAQENFWRQERCKNVGLAVPYFSSLFCFILFWNWKEGWKIVVGWVGHIFLLRVTQWRKTQCHKHSFTPSSLFIEQCLTFFLEENLQSHFVWSYFPFDLLCFADSLIDLWVRSWVKLDVCEI